MAAWGMVGLAGGAIGRLSRRRLGRVGLALACAVTALAAKELMNLYTWTLGASHSPAAFLLVAAAALPFDVTDVIASFLLVALVLGVGWGAYERRRPSARMAAVVAVMAALAALGRDAFAALPDVKPITAITLVTGYALGPLPGFTVGALGMLASNFILG